MTARDRRALIAAAAVMMLAIAVRLGVPALAALRARLDAAREATTVAGRARALIAEGPARQALLRERAREMVDLAPLLLSGGTPVEAAASLAGEVNGLAARHRLGVSRLDPLPDSAAGAFIKIEVRLQAETDLRGLYGFLHAVENGRLLLSVTEVAVTAQDPTAAMERLRLDAAVRGWMVRP